MAVINLVSGFVSCDLDVFGVDDDDVIPGIYMGCVFRLVFAAQTPRDLGGQSTQGFAFGVDQEPVVFYIFCPDAKSLHLRLRDYR